MFSQTNTSQENKPVGKTIDVSLATPLCEDRQTEIKTEAAQRFAYKTEVKIVINDKTVNNYDRNRALL